jgi:hypothetical protein
MRSRLIPIDFVALLFLAFAIFFPWPHGLNDYKGWAIRTALTILSIFAMVLHLVLNATLFNKRARYFRLTADALVFVMALLWQLNLLIGLQGMR